MFYNGIFISETSSRECEHRVEAWKDPFWPLGALAGGPLLNGEVIPEAQVCSGSKHLYRETPVFTEQLLHFQHSTEDY